MQGIHGDPQQNTRASGRQMEWRWLEGGRFLKGSKWKIHMYVIWIGVTLYILPDAGTVGFTRSKIKRQQQ